MVPAIAKSSLATSQMSWCQNHIIFTKVTYSLSHKIFLCGFAVLLIFYKVILLPDIASFMGPSWGPSGAVRTQVGPMLAPWTLLSGLILVESCDNSVLTQWGRVTHICVSKLTIIGSDNGLSPGRRQAIIWTNDGILLIRTLGINFSEILSAIHAFSLMKMHLKMSSAKWRPFCLGINVLMKYELTHCGLVAPYMWRHKSGSTFAQVMA